VRGQSRGRSGGFGRGGAGFPSGRRIPLSGLSFKTLAILVVIGIVLQFMGVDVLSMLTGQGGPATTQQTTNRTPTSAEDKEMGAFVATVLAETEDVWNGIFQASGSTYEEPKLTLFSGAWSSACGTASAASGPFYCPLDKKVYLDTDFFNEMATRFKASGDFAQAYVIAHEVGHHVQNLTGVLPKFNQARRSMSKAEANAMSVRVELQADCFAGIWAKYTEQKGLLETGDIEEALNAAHQIGDDALQKQTQGYVVPDSFTHGTSQQRMTWFKRGFASGRFEDCDTFSGDV
jgi:predicted metalloprotease